MIHALIINDDISVCMAIRQILKSAGYEAQVCLPIKAKEALEMGDYNVVITGILMQEVDGVEISRFIREELIEEKRGVAIMALCDDEDQPMSGNERDMIKPFINCVLSKPIESEQILQKMFEFVADA